MAIELSIIIVNWNCGELLHRCIRSLIAAPPSLRYEVVVVDNASTDGSCEGLEAFDSHLRLIRNKENVGFGRAVNQGFAVTESPFVFLVNPDAEVPSSTIETLVNTLNSDKRIGACGPRILNSDGSTQVSVWLNPPNVWQIFLSNLKLYLLLPRRLRGELLLGGHWRHDRKRSVPMLSGAAILVRREVIEQAGGFDEQFHMYGEDIEWCWRIRKAGWELVFEPAAVIVHHSGQSAKQRWTNLEKLEVQIESAFLFEIKTLSRRRLIANQFAYYLTTSLQKLRHHLSRNERPDVDLAQRLYREHLQRSRSASPQLRSKTCPQNVRATSRD